MSGLAAVLGRRPEPPPRTPTGAPALSCADITVVRGGRPVLREVGLEVRAGELVAVVGPNGSGKSTTLSVLAGDLRPTSGTVTIAGRPRAARSLAELAMLRAVLPQHTSVAFPFSVAQVVAMGRAPWAGTSLADRDDAEVAAAMEETEVSAFAHRGFATLSGGERARVALARVLAQRTGVVLLDEPTAALDLRHQDMVMRAAADLAAAGAAVLAVLHDLNLATAYADRVALLDDGRLVSSGAPAEVFTSGRLTEVYRRRIEVVDHPRTGSPLVLPVR